jgi:hypothetical protein
MDSESRVILCQAVGTEWWVGRSITCPEHVCLAIFLAGLNPSVSRPLHDRLAEVLGNPEARCPIYGRERTPSEA